MADLDRAVATQLANIEKRTGQSLDQLRALVQASGLSKHGEMVAMLKRTLGMGHGDANTLVHFVRQGGAPGSSAAQDRPMDEVLDELYAGPKATLRPIHERLLEELERIGPYQATPKKSYVSYRRQKQFATIGPATKSQVEVGFNMKGVEATDRLREQPAGKMCNYKVRLGGIEEVDPELIGWLRTAYEASG